MGRNVDYVAIGISDAGYAQVLINDIAETFHGGEPENLWVVRLSAEINNIHRTWHGSIHHNGRTIRRRECGPGCR